MTEGITEIWLTSEDTGAYGRDIGVRLPYLLRGIIEILDRAYLDSGKEVVLRVGMTNPPYILDDLAEIAELLNHPRVYKFLHIPVQSGSDRVLDSMRRMYTVADFRHIVDFLRGRVPGITIATDLICGFPTETDNDHRGSLELVRDYRFSVLHISQFYPRPGTPAARMPRLNTSVGKQRSREVTALFESYQSFASLVGQVYRVWITDEQGTDSSEAKEEDEEEDKDENERDRRRRRQQRQDAGEPRDDAHDDSHDDHQGDPTLDPSFDDYRAPAAHVRIENAWVAHNHFYHQILIPKRQVQSAFARAAKAAAMQQQLAEGEREQQSPSSPSLPSPSSPSSWSSPPPPSLLGHVCEVRVVRAGKYFMVGHVEDVHSVRRANGTDITSQVLVHRTGRNNRSAQVTQLKAVARVATTAVPPSTPSAPLAPHSSTASPATTVKTTAPAASAPAPTQSLPLSRRTLALAMGMVVVGWWFARRFVDVATTSTT